MTGMLLTADDFTKSYSRQWPRKSLVQWIEDTFGHDDDVCDAAYMEAFRCINGDDYHEYDSDDMYSISIWSEKEDTTYEHLASCWNSVARRIDDLYGERMVMPRIEEHLPI